MILLYTAGIVSLIMLAVFIAKVIRFVNMVNHLVERNRASFSQMLDSLKDLVIDGRAAVKKIDVTISQNSEAIPVIVKNIEGITGDIRSGMTQITQTVQGASSQVNRFSSLLSKGTNDFGFYIKAGGLVIRFIRNLLKKDDKS